MVCVVAWGLTAGCEADKPSGASEPAAASEKNESIETANNGGSEAPTQPTANDPWLDRDFPQLTASYDGEPVEIRAAIAFDWELSNNIGTPEGARRIHLFTAPTNCKEGKKLWVKDGYEGPYAVFQFQRGEASIRHSEKNSISIGNFGSVWGSLDFSKVDTTLGVESTIEIEAVREADPEMGAPAFSVQGTVTVVGCGVRD